MNQVTNLIQHKNLKQEQKDDFDFENYDYVYQGRDDCWYTGEASGEHVHRLVIVDDKWYTRTDDDGQQLTALGEDIDKATIEYALSLRPAKPDEIPQPEKTLEQKIQEKWPDKEVVMLTPENGMLRIVKTVEECEYDSPHVNAQSMKGFHKYVYELLSGKLELNTRPIMPGVLPTLQPVAVLFERSVK
tara:strand:- start:3951 stop:4514 length:564 start_codon:yes stop_codon:yes gene_type:complete